MGSFIRNSAIGGGTFFLMRQMLSDEPVMGDDSFLSDKAIKLLAKKSGNSFDSYENIRWKDLSQAQIALLFKAFSSRSVYSTESKDSSEPNRLAFTSKWKNLPKFFGASTAKMKKYSRASDTLAVMLKNYYGKQEGADLEILNTLIDVYTKNTKGSQILSVKDACNLANTMDSILSLSAHVKDIQANAPRQDDGSGLISYILSDRELDLIDLHDCVKEIVNVGKTSPKALVKLCDKISKYLPTSSHTRSFPSDDNEFSSFECRFSPQDLNNIFSRSKYCESLKYEYMKGMANETNDLQKKMKSIHRTQSVLSFFDNKTFSGNLIRKGAIVAAAATVPLMLGVFPVFSGLYFTISVGGSVTGLINAGLVTGFTAGFATSATMAGVGGTASLLTSLKNRFSRGKSNTEGSASRRFKDRWKYDSNATSRAFNEILETEKVDSNSDICQRTVSDMSGIRESFFIDTSTEHRVYSAMFDSQKTPKEKASYVLSKAKEQLTKFGIHKFFNLQVPAAALLTADLQQDLSPQQHTLLKDLFSIESVNECLNLLEGRENSFQNNITENVAAGIVSLSTLMRLFKHSPVAQMQIKLLEIIKALLDSLQLTIDGRRDGDSDSQSGRRRRHPQGHPSSRRSSSSSDDDNDDSPPRGDGVVRQGSVRSLQINNVQVHDEEDNQAIPPSQEEEGEEVSALQPIPQQNADVPQVVVSQAQVLPEEEGEEEEVSALQPIPQQNVDVPQEEEGEDNPSVDPVVVTLANMLTEAMHQQLDSAQREEAEEEGVIPPVQEEGVIPPVQEEGVIPPVQDERERRDSSSSQFSVRGPELNEVSGEEERAETPEERPSFGRRMVNTVRNLFRRTGKESKEMVPPQEEGERPGSSSSQYSVRSPELNETSVEEERAKTPEERPTFGRRMLNTVRDLFRRTGAGEEHELREVSQPEILVSSEPISQVADNAAEFEIPSVNEAAVIHPSNQSQENNEEEGSETSEEEPSFGRRMMNTVRNLFRRTGKESKDMSPPQGEVERRGSIDSQYSIVEPERSEVSGEEEGSETSEERPSLGRRMLNAARGFFKRTGATVREGHEDRHELRESSQSQPEERGRQNSVNSFESISLTDNEEDSEKNDKPTSGRRMLNTFRDLFRRKNKEGKPEGRDLGVGRSSRRGSIDSQRSDVSRRASTHSASAQGIYVDRNSESVFENPLFRGGQEDAPNEDSGPDRAEARSQIEPEEGNKKKKKSFFSLFRSKKTTEKTDERSNTPVDSPIAGPAIPGVSTTLSERELEQLRLQDLDGNRGPDWFRVDLQRTEEDDKDKKEGKKKGRSVAGWFKNLFTKSSGKGTSEEVEIPEILVTSPPRSPRGTPPLGDEEDENRIYDLLPSQLQRQDQERADEEEDGDADPPIPNYPPPRGPEQHNLEFSLAMNEEDFDDVPLNDVDEGSRASSPERRTPTPPLLRPVLLRDEARAASATPPSSPVPKKEPAMPFLDPTLALTLSNRRRAHEGSDEDSVNNNGNDDEWEDVSLNDVDEGSRASSPERRTPTPPLPRPVLVRDEARAASPAPPSSPVPKKEPVVPFLDSTLALTLSNFRSEDEKPRRRFSE